MLVTYGNGHHWVFNEDKPLHEEHQSQRSVKEVIMTNNVEEVINQGVKPQIQSITTPT